MIKARELRPVVTYPRDAILETGHLCAALGVSEEIINKMDLPCFSAGTRVRFVWGQVLDELERRAAQLAPTVAPAPAMASAGRRRVG